MHRLATLATALLVVTAGCLATAGSPGTDAEPDPIEPTTDEPTDDPTDTPGTLDTGERTFETTNCSDAIQWVSFYGLGSPGELGLWSQDRAAVGYTVRGNASVFLVAYANGSRLGVDHVSTTGLDHGVTADGDGVRFDEPLTESRAIRVVAHRDADRDGTFDPETDLACHDDEGLVSTGVEIVDFGSLDPASTANGTKTAR